MAVYGVAPMVPGSELPQELQQRRSSQASNLQSQQAQMGVPGQQGPAPAPAGGQAPPGAEGQTFSGIMQERQQQAQGLQARQADIQLGERLMQVLDPRLPRQARQFLFKELSRQIGIDPKGERSRELGSMLTGMEPEVLEGLRRNIADRVQSAQPGEVMQLTRGVFTGQVPITQLMSGQGQAQGQAQAQPAEAGPAAAAGNFPPGMMRLGGPGAGMAGALAAAGQGAGAENMVTRTQTGPIGSTVGPMREGPQRMPEQAAPTTETPPMAQHMPPLLREPAPELVSVLGLDPSVRYRNRDLYRAGFRNIPSTEAEQQKLAQEMHSLQGGLVNTLVMGNHLAALVDGRPEVLNMNIGRVPWIGDFIAPNPASMWAQLTSTMEGMAKNAGWRGIEEGITTERGAELQRQAQDITRRWFGNRPAEERAATQDAANVNAQMNSLLINMAFAMAAAKGQTGRFLSDRDVELQLQELGRTANPEQFVTTLRANMQRMYDQYNVNVANRIGATVPLSSSVTPEAREALANGMLTPERMRAEVGGGTPPTSSVNPRGTERNPWNLGEPYIGAKPGDYAADEGGALFRFGGEPGELQAIPSPTGQAPRRPATPSAPAAPAGPRTIERTGPTVEDEEAAARTRIREDRAAQLAAQSRAERTLEISESSERRAARMEIRNEERYRREQIQQAFGALAQAFRGGGSSAGVSVGAGGGGEGQDVRAFQVQPNPQRRAPTPVNASRFQRDQ